MIKQRDIAFCAAEAMACGSQALSNSIRRGVYRDLEYKALVAEVEKGVEAARNLSNFLLERARNEDT